MKIEIHQISDKAFLSIQDENISAEIKLTDKQLEDLEYMLTDVSHAIMKFKQSKRNSDD